MPLPAPLGLVYLGKLYAYLTSFCYVSMGNGINLTDGLDGLAGGTAAIAFVGMSIAVLPISCGMCSCTQHDYLYNQMLCPYSKFLRRV